MSFFTHIFSLENRAATGYQPYGVTTRMCINAEKGFLIQNPEWLILLRSFIALVIGKQFAFFTITGNSSPQAASLILFYIFTTVIDSIHEEQ